MSVSEQTSANAMFVSICGF